MLQRFLNSSGISGLDLVAKTVADGFVASLHRSPDFGFSQEFAEYCAQRDAAGLHRLLAGLERAEARARTDFAKPTHYFQELLKRRGMVLIVSDFIETAGMGGGRN